MNHIPNKKAEEEEGKKDRNRCVKKQQKPHRPHETAGRHSCPRALHANQAEGALCIHSCSGPNRQPAVGIWDSDGWINRAVCAGKWDILHGISHLTLWGLATSRQRCLRGE